MSMSCRACYGNGGKWDNEKKTFTECRFCHGTGRITAQWFPDQKN